MDFEAQCGDIVYVLTYYTKEVKAAAVKARVVGIVTTEKLETKGSIDKKLYDLQVIDGCGLLLNGSIHGYAANSGYLFTNRQDAEKAAKEELEKAIFRGSISRLNVIMQDIETYRQRIDNRIIDMKRELDDMRECMKILAKEA